MSSCRNEASDDRKGLSLVPSTTMMSPSSTTDLGLCVKIWGDSVYVVARETLLATKIFSAFDAPPVAFCMQLFRTMALWMIEGKFIKEKDLGTKNHFKQGGPETAAFSGYAPRPKHLNNPFVLGSAIMGRQQDLASMIIRQGGVDLTETYRGLSWVGLACEAGLPHLVQELCENCNQGPLMLMTPGEEIRHGIMPLHLACGNGHIHVVRYLADRFTPQATFEVDVADDQDINSLAGAQAALVGTGGGRNKPTPRVDWNAQCQHGTPLHYAALNGHTDVVSIIAQLPGVDVQARAKQGGGVTPLHVACKHRRVEVIKLLLRRFHVNPMALDDDGQTPLHHVCKYTGPEVPEVVELIEYFATFPNMEFGLAAYGATSGASGVTILHEAASSRNVSAVRAILRCCCEPWTAVRSETAIDKEGGDPVGQEGATTFSDKFPVPKSYVDPNILTKGAEESALHKAVFQRALPCIDALCECPLVDLKAIVTSTGQTIVHIACSVGNRAVLGSVLSHIRNRIQWEASKENLTTTTKSRLSSEEVQAILDRDYLSVRSLPEAGDQIPSEVALDFGYKGLAEMVRVGGTSSSNPPASSS